MEKELENPEKRNLKFDKFVDKVLSIFFSKDKTKLYLLILLVVGFILRVIAAVNLSVAADDMHFTVHAMNFIKSGKLATWDQGPLWNCLADISYRLFGKTQFSSRFPTVLFGTLSIILIFLFTKQFFSKETALVSAFLFTFSPFLIKNTLAEMDVVAMFFALLSLFLFVATFKQQKKYLTLSAIFMGLGILTKLYVMMFIPPMLIFSFSINKKIDKRLVKKSVYFLIIVFVVSLPIVAHNYLLYKDRGIMDFQFTRMFGLGKEKAAQFYSGFIGWGLGTDIRGFFLGNSKIFPGYTPPTSIYALGFVFFPDPLLFVLGIIGLILCFEKNKKFFLLTLLLILPPFVYLASSSLLSKHYIFLSIFLTPCAAYLITQIKEKYSKIRLKYIFLVLAVFYLIFLGFNAKYSMPQFYSKSEVQSMMEYKKNIEQNSLVIADSRIYRGQIHWMFNGLNYIEASSFLQAQEYFRNSTDAIPIKVYFVECVPDDCGWGTIKSQPEFNSTMESLTEIFKNNSLLRKIIYSTRNKKSSFPLISKDKDEQFKVYSGTFMLNPQIFSVAKSQKSWFLYPIEYDESIQPIFDNYTTHNLLDSLIDRITHWVLYLAIFFSLISIFLSLCLFIRKNET